MRVWCRCYICTDESAINQLQIKPTLSTVCLTNYIYGVLFSTSYSKLYTIIGKLQLLALTGAFGWLSSVSRISLKCHYAVTTMSMRTLPCNGFKAIIGNLYTWYQYRSQQCHLLLCMNHCVGMPQCLFGEYHFSSVTLGRQHPACCITKNHNHLRSWCTAILKLQAGSPQQM